MDVGVPLHLVMQLLVCHSQPAADLIIGVRTIAQPVYGTQPAGGALGWGGSSSSSPIRTEKDWILMQPPDEVVQEAELNESPLIHIECLWIKADAQVPHAHPVRHAVVR